MAKFNIWLLIYRIGRLKADMTRLAMEKREMKTFSANRLTRTNMPISSNIKFVKSILVPNKVKVKDYRISYPLIRPSKLTSKERGGIGKKLSNGWALNFAVGCIHKCLFCYVDSIYKRYGEHVYGSIVKKRWGDYLLIPSNIDEALVKTPWRKWEGEEVLLSSTHDPYLPQLAPIARKILERALPLGIKFCIQTRSPLVEHDFDLFTEYRDNIRLQVSIATIKKEFSMMIETRVSSPKVRLDILKRAKKRGLRTGVILAPIFPPLRARPDLEGDLKAIMYELSKIKPDNIYGESIHIRGENIRWLKQALGEEITDLDTFDLRMNNLFAKKLKEYGLQGTWWLEHRHLKK